ncbi:MAG: B12-binding domain-containing radical SAM protein [Dehalococcoidia bacterium]|nr:B12-binding domain-containing radical SAM protein [Dehalococcoidia bacterium]
MKILLVYPHYPDTFWSFTHALKFVAKKAAHPPLGLLTVASMLPHGWEKRLVDMNVASLKDEDIRWADYVFISAMVVQRSSVREVIKRCKELGKKVVAGGPLFSTEPGEFTDVDHLVLNEAEVTLPLFLTDLAQGSPKSVYTSGEHPDVCRTPVPLWSLINMKSYASMSIQYSRGCPFNCEFCDIVFLDGHIPRTKGTQQMLDELEALYNIGWRGSIFIVDDNFIGNKKKLKVETMPAIIEWMERKRNPFNFITEASINLADDDELIDLMVKAGFCRVFIGIETPNEASLSECDKRQNMSRDLVASVKKIQNSGLEVMGGFIVGFDSDPISIFKSQINFIQKSGIVTAMVGLLNAPKGTRLYQRLKKENRLLKDSTFTGDNTDFSLNFIPKMNRETLINGYQQVLNTIYSPKPYYDRILTLLKEYRPKHKTSISQLKFDDHIRGFFQCVWSVGIREKGRRYFWRLFASALFRYPRHIPLFITLAAYGYHFRKVVGKYIGTPVKDTVGS